MTKSSKKNLSVGKGRAQMAQLVENNMVIFPSPALQLMWDICLGLSVHIANKIYFTEST